MLLVQTGREMHLFVSSQLGFRRVFGRESRRESTLGGIDSDRVVDRVRGNFIFGAFADISSLTCIVFGIVFWMSFCFACFVVELERRWIFEVQVRVRFLLGFFFVPLERNGGQIGLARRGAGKRGAKPLRACPQSGAAERPNAPPPIFLLVLRTPPR